MVLQKTALFRKLKSLEDIPPGTLAGKMATVIDLTSRLPVEIWLKTKAATSVHRRIKSHLQR